MPTQVDSDEYQRKNNRMVVFSSCDRNKDCPEPTTVQLSSTMTMGELYFELKKVVRGCCKHNGDDNEEPPAFIATICKGGAQNKAITKRDTRMVAKLVDLESELKAVLIHVELYQLQGNQSDSPSSSLDKSSIHDNEYESKSEGD